MILFAGVLQVKYDNGFLRYFTYGGSEVLRMIYISLRDENWGTCTPVIRNEKIDSGPDNFNISYDCYHRQDGEDIMVWKTTIQGRSDGSVIFSIDGRSLKDFKRNRAGLCILHPIKEMLNKPAEISHPDGTITESNFPDLVSPENPFRQIEKLRWPIGGNWYELNMEGEVFETEDQRNWTDASFKTFCTPSALPIPVLLKKGDTIRQKVTFNPVAPLKKISTPEKEVVMLKATEKKIQLPSVGVAASTEFDHLSEAVIAKLKALQFDHYRVDVKPDDEHWVVKLSNDYQHAFELDLPVEVALHLTNRYVHETEAFIQLCLQNRVRIKSIILLSENKPVTDQKVIGHATVLREAFPKTFCGAGTDVNFTELNRNRFDAGRLDFVGYTIHPQVHAFDDTSLIENIEGQKETARSGRQIYFPKDIHISYVTLKKRIDPDASNRLEKTLTNDQRTDPRQQTDFCARWTFGSLRALAEGEVRSATYYQTAGNQGVVSDTASIYPVYNLFSKLLPFRKRDAFVLENSDPLKVDAMLFRDFRSTTLWVVNHTDETQQVIFEDQQYDLHPGEIKEVVLDRAK